MNRINGVATFALSVVRVARSPTSLWFWAGRRYGYPVLRFLCKVSLSPDTCVRQTEGIFQRWGFFSVVVSKFVPGFSTVGPPIAGALKMPVGAFVVASLASAALWVGAAMGVGLVFSREIELALTWMTEQRAAGGDCGRRRRSRLYLGYKALAALAAVALRRFGAASSIDELRERLSQDPRPFRRRHRLDARAPVAPAHSAARRCSTSTRSPTRAIFRSTARSSSTATARTRRRRSAPRRSC